MITTLNRQEQTVVKNVCHSPVTGNNGTLEFFLQVAFGSFPAPELAQQARAAVQAALALKTYHKQRG